MESRAQSATSLRDRCCNSLQGRARPYVFFSLFYFCTLRQLEPFVNIYTVCKQSNRSGKTSRMMSGAQSTEDPASAGVDYSTAAGAGSLPIMAGLSTSSHEGSLKGKSSKTSTRWSGLFSSNYKVNVFCYHCGSTC